MCVCAGACVCIVCTKHFSKTKCQVSDFFHQKDNLRIKIKMGYYPLNRWCGVPNTFPTRNQTSESKIFG